MAARGESKVEALRRAYDDAARAGDVRARLRALQALVEALAAVGVTR